MILTQDNAVADTFSKQFNDYVKNLLTVTAYHHAIGNLVWPILQFPSGEGTDKYKNARDTYNNYVSNGGAVLQSHSQEWINAVLPLLFSSPSVIIFFDNIFEADYDNMKQYLEKLIENPSDKLSKQALVNTLSSLQLSLKQKEQVFTNTNVNNPGILEVLTNFLADFNNDLTTLQKGVDTITAMVNADKAMVDTLNAKLDKLNKDLDTVNQDIDMAAAGIGVSIFATIIGIALLPEFPELIVGGVVGTATSAVLLKRYQTKLASDYNNIKLLNDQSDKVGKDTTALIITNNSVQQIQVSLKNAMNALVETNKLWNGLNSELEVIITDINDSMGAIKGKDPDYKLILSNLATANKDWQDLTSQLTGISKMNIQYQSKVEMLPNQVAA